jgi:CheY-like chemotaxis protein
MEHVEGSWFVDADAPKMERVFFNVISNAVKFTPEGGQIRVQLHADAEREGFAVVCVDDTGIGIPAEALERVTERYYRVGEQVTGTGLGLSISKEIVEMHDGTLVVASPVPGMTGGTRVSVALPVVAGPLVVLWCPSQPGSEALQHVLEQQGYSIRLVHDIGDARLALVHDRPSLVVVDMVPPGDEGCAFVLEAQGHRVAGKVPVVVLADDTMRHARRDLLQHFAAAVVMKPWDEAGLLDAVTSVFLGRTATVH